MTTSNDFAKFQLLFEDIYSERRISLRLNIPKATVHDKMHRFSSQKSPAIMIWGSISGSGRAGIHIMLQEKTINAETYLGILQEKLLMWIDLQSASM